jgi:hypothetical protein
MRGLRSDRGAYGISSDRANVTASLNNSIIRVAASAPIVLVRNVGCHYARIA